MARKVPSSRTLSVFLTARWVNLALVTYAVPDALLRGRLHPSLEIDHWEGQAHVSLVAFDFRETRVIACPVPGFRSFPEVNLRTYVRHAGRRGVAFIREFVPQRLVAVIARKAYNEPYRATRMESATAIGKDRVCITHRWHWARRDHTLTAVGSALADLPEADSREHHFKEHEWGFGQTRDGQLLRYRVQHPVWAVRTVHDLTLDVDFGLLYGDDWAWLTDATPASVIFAVGSPVLVHTPEVVGEANRE